MRRSSVLLVIAALLLAAPAYAQRSTGAIRGTVKDATQAMLPGATVTATNEDTGLIRATTTSGAGVYSIPDLPVGRYKVSAELQGFKTATRTGIQLRVADDLAVDFELATGAVTET